MKSGETLAGEIRRKTAEIDTWPAWAKPFEPSASPAERESGATPARHDRTDEDDPTRREHPE